MVSMATPVEVSHIKRAGLKESGTGVKQSGMEGLGGTWRDRPWYMSERNVIWEIGRPDGERQWDFFVVIDGVNVLIAVTAIGGRSCLVAAGKPLTLLGLREWLRSVPTD
jgi:hypothetical protein